MSKTQVNTSTPCRLGHSKSSSSHLKKSDSDTSVDNSFLDETTFNSDVDCGVRCEIEKKFKNSITNSSYKFPRISNYTDLQPISKYRIHNSRSVSKYKGFDRSLTHVTKSNSSYYDILNAKSTLINQPQFSKLETVYAIFDQVQGRYNLLNKTKRLPKICTNARNTPSPLKPRHFRWKSDALASSKVKFTPYFSYPSKNASQAVPTICTTARNTPSPLKSQHVRWKSDVLVSSKVKFTPYFQYPSKNISQAVPTML